MEGVLLVGEANYVIGGIYKSLYEKYRVQICAANKVLVENMISIVEPRLILIGMYGTDNFDKNILEYFQHLNPRIPVIFIGTFEECKDYITIYNDRLFDFLERPVTQRDIEKKCEEVINKSGMTKEKTGNSDGSEKKAKQKILVVDDSGVFLRTIKSLLELRYDIILAKSGEKGISIATSESPDLILLDYEMPGLNGRETLEQLRNIDKTKNIPVIFLTGVKEKEHILEVLKLQPQGYLLKPVDSNELENKIEEVLR